MMPPSSFVVEGGEVHALRAAQADVDDVDAGVGEAADQRLRELVAGQADVAPDATCFGLTNAA